MAVTSEDGAVLTNHHVEQALEDSTVGTLDKAGAITANDVAETSYVVATFSLSAVAKQVTPIDVVDARSYFVSSTSVS